MSLDTTVQRLAAEVRDLQVQNAALLALIATLPDTSKVDNEEVRSALDKIIDHNKDIISGDQVARAMHFVQLLTRLGGQ